MVFFQNFSCYHCLNKLTPENIWGSHSVLKKKQTAYYKCNRVNSGREFIIFHSDTVRAFYWLLFWLGICRDWKHLCGILKLFSGFVNKDGSRFNLCPLKKSLKEKSAWCVLEFRFSGTCSMLDLNKGCTRIGWMSVFASTVWLILAYPKIRRCLPISGALTVFSS